MRRVLVLLALLLSAFPAAADQTAAAFQPLLPSNRVVTYYGNPLSARMGILGELPPDLMLRRLDEQAREWAKADPKTKVRPGLELVATVASDYPQADGTYRARMDRKLIEKVCSWARGKGWLIILDIQVGRSHVKEEVERLRPFLERPDVHLALDPEFQMRKGLKPGQRIGSSDAEDVNIASGMLAEMVEKKKLPPKLLLVHRFTNDMLRRYKRIRLDPRVQIAVIMDGFGSPQFKLRAYRATVAREPVEYTGVKLFYKNDKPLMTPKEVLSWSPTPMVIVYQ